MCHFVVSGDLPGAQDTSTWWQVVSGIAYVELCMLCTGTHHHSLPVDAAPHLLPPAQVATPQRVVSATD
jgi:hypothetical protein